MNEIDMSFSAFLDTFHSTKEIEIPTREIDKIIGQEEAVQIIKIAAKQKRHVLLIGEPGVGKSMIGKAYSDIMEHGEPKDILFYPNPEDPSRPRVLKLEAGKGKQTIAQLRQQRNRRIDKIFTNYRAEIFLLILFLIMIVTGQLNFQNAIFVLLLWIIFRANNRRTNQPQWDIPILAFSAEDDVDFFVNGTGLQAGGLFGDVLHDPYQSGGLETPPHKRLVLGAVHKADGGVLYIDEVGNLDYETQIELLTILQDRKAPIRGRSKESTSSTIYTDPIPTDFSLLMAGNLETLDLLHPALRSRIQGYGYEIFMKTEMEDNLENRKKIVRFIAQEVVADGRIPHFSRGAVGEIIKIVKALSITPNHLTLKLRKVAGIIHIAGDIAILHGAKIVDAQHVKDAALASVPIEFSIALRQIHQLKGAVAVIPPSVLYNDDFIWIKAEKIGNEKLEIIINRNLSISEKDFVEKSLPNLLRQIGITVGKFIVEINGQMQEEDLGIGLVTSIRLAAEGMDELIFCTGFLHNDGNIVLTPLQLKRKMVMDIILTPLKSKVNLTDGNTLPEIFNKQYS